MAIDPEKMLGFNLHVAAFALKQALKNALKEADVDLTTEEFVLFMLIPADGIEQAALQDKLHKDKTNITRLLDRLAAKELVYRQTSQVSRRQQLVSLTNTGVSAREPLTQLLMDFSERALADIPLTDQQIAVNSLRQLTKNVS